MKDEWQVRDDLRTLIEAEKIKTDKSRLSNVLKLFGQQKKLIENIETQKRGVKNGK